ncbi:unnamed protein product [Amaranthus hypochondriacus]
MEEQVKEMQSKMMELQTDFNNKFEMLLSRLNEKSVATGSSPKSRREETVCKPLAFVPKLEFPKFDGSNPNEWIRKACKYFELCKVTEEQKVDLASLYIVDKAAVWVASFLAMKPLIGWVKFTMAVRARFLDDSLKNGVENFSKLSQVGSLEEYVDAFECSRSFLEMHDYDLSSKFLLDSFVSGLHDTIKPFVKAFKPENITQAIEYARLQSESIKSLHDLSTKSTWKNHMTPPKPPLLPTPLLPTPPELKQPNSKVSTNFNANAYRNNRFVPAKVKAEKIAQGICYLCDKPM